MRLTCLGKFGAHTTLKLDESSVEWRNIESKTVRSLEAERKEGWNVQLRYECHTSYKM